LNLDDVNWHSKGPFRNTNRIVKGLCIAQICIRLCLRNEISILFIQIFHSPYKILNIFTFSFKKSGYSSVSSVLTQHNTANDETYQLDATIMIYSHKQPLHVSDIYMSIFRSFLYTGSLLLHAVFSTRCCGCGPTEPVCSLVHCV